MPTGPKGQKRPADVIGNAVHTMRVATGQINEGVDEAKDKRDPAAIALGRKGGYARADKLSKARLAEIARKAARSRWQKKR